MKWAVKKDEWSEILEMNDYAFSLEYADNLENDSTISSSFSLDIRKHSVWKIYEQLD